jgi:hypothetical protein
MRIDTPQPTPRSEGDYRVDPTSGYGEPWADIWLDEKGDLRLQYLKADDCDRLIRAAVDAKAAILGYQAQAAAWHGTARIHQGQCQLCGKPEADELHAAAVNPDAPAPGDGQHDEDPRQLPAAAEDGPGCCSYQDGYKCVLTGEHELHRDELGNRWPARKPASVTA